MEKGVGWADSKALFRNAIEGYVHDVEERSFPDESESYHLSKEVTDALKPPAAKARLLAKT